ncbi:MAG: hypothetical protein R2732_05400 [Microbacteriaceae bacterium]
MTGFKFKAHFPLPRSASAGKFPGAARNNKAIREAILLDTMGNGYEDRLVDAANRAKDADQEVYVSRSYGPAGRVSVWIVDQGAGERMKRRKALQAALGRVGV